MPEPKPTDLKDYLHLLKPGQRIYFIGIGGISMSGLAEMAVRQGLVAGGSDRGRNARTAALEKLGVPVNLGHEAAAIDRFQPDLVVYTRAIPATNPERVRAMEKQIPCLERAVYLGLLNRTFQSVINISGTNGKTTTTAMTALILMASGVDPTVHLGAELQQFESTVRLGKPGRLMVSEACEFGRGFLNFFSTTAAILNIDHDHIDCFPTLDDVLQAFYDFVLTLQPGARLVLPAFDANVAELVARLRQAPDRPLDQLELVWFGSAETTVDGRAPDWTYDQLRFVDGRPHFRVSHRGTHYTDIALRIPGRFNLENALAAIACAGLNGGTPEACQRVLNDFRGAEGRFTLTGSYRGAKLIADYAHHPASVRATIEAAAELPHRRLLPAFQPITFSRAKGLADDFVAAMCPFRPIYLVEIFDDRESDHSFSSKDLADRINAAGGDATYFESPAALEQFLRAEATEGDLILLMGQDIRWVADRMAGRTDHMKPVAESL